MTPQDRLKEIEADFKTANPRYNSATMIKSDIKWLIARVKQLQSENTHLKEQLSEANKKLEVANTYLGVIKQYRYNTQFIEEAVDQALAQLTDKREKECLE